MAWWALSVDLGTTFCAAVVARDGGRLEVLEVAGERRTPSTLLWRDGRLLAGRYADSLRAARPETAERNPKRLTGGPPMMLDREEVAAATALAALLDRFVAEGRRRFDGSDPARLVLTCPAAWTGAQRDVLRDCAAEVLPGIPLTLIPEPVAAATEVAAAHELDAGTCLAVFDLGGGTLDVAVLRVVTGAGAGVGAGVGVGTDSDGGADLDGDDGQFSTGFEVVGTPQRADDLGGERFDRLLMDHFVAELRQTPWWQRTQAESGPVSLRDLDELLRTARLLKEALSELDEAEAFFAPAGVELRVTRASYDELIADDVQRQIAVLEAALASAAVTARELSGVYLIGAASRTTAT